MSLFFSSDGRSFHTDGADEWKPCTVHERRTRDDHVIVVEHKLQHVNWYKDIIKVAWSLTTYTAMTFGFGDIWRILWHLCLISQTVSTNYIRPTCLGQDHSVLECAILLLYFCSNEQLSISHIRRRRRQSHSYWRLDAKYPCPLPSSKSCGPQSSGAERRQTWSLYAPLM